MTDSVVMRCDVESFDRTRAGVIWGKVWVAIGAEGFPEVGWNDILAPVLIGAIKATNSMRMVGDVGRFTFFDGPFDVEMTLDERDMIALDMRRSGGTLAQTRVVRDSWVSSLAHCGV